MAPGIVLDVPLGLLMSIPGMLSWAKALLKVTALVRSRVARRALVVRFIPLE